MAGLVAWAPVKTPVFALSPVRRATMSVFAASARYEFTRPLWSGVVSASTRGCSGAITMKVAPKIVSGRVV
ncbi:hypothetical protein D3C83_231510 [compost metagenome]